MALLDRYVVERPQEPITLYRWIKGTRVKLRDFKSNREMGRRRLVSEDAAMWGGISAFDSVESARRRASLIGAKGRGFEAVVPFVVDGRAGQVLARTFGRAYRTVWGDPSDFLSSAGDPMPL